MELDELKSKLKSRLETDINEYSSKELEHYFRRKTLSIMGKVRRSLVLEIVLAVVIVTVFVGGWFYYPYHYVRFFCALSMLVCIFFVYYLLVLNRKIVFYEQSSFSVSESLRQIIDILHRFTKLYFQLSMITLPLVFVMGLIVGYLEVTEEGLGNKFHWTKGFLLYGGCFIVWSIFIYFFTQWYLQKLYGKHIKTLKDQLRELENG